jgi:hypothetical protein
MKLYVGRLPGNVTHLALTKFFHGYEKSVSFQIRQLAGIEDEPITYALVTVNSERVGNKLIAKFNGALLKGKPVLVREFSPRAAGNERRAVNWRAKPWKFFDRRKNERRQSREMKVQENLWLEVYRQDANAKIKQANG